MKRISPISLSLFICLAATAVPLFAHHAISAEFDTTKPIKFEGTVKTVDWMNPHIYINIETIENGKPVVYSVEGGPPNALYRQGWRPDSLKVGDKVQVSGIRAKKADSNRVGQAQIVMPDGRVFARGASNQ
jgi:hypothetical protein